MIQTVIDLVKRDSRAVSGMLGKVLCPVCKLHPPTPDALDSRLPGVVTYQKWASIPRYNATCATPGCVDLLWS